jgi:hemolysin III
LELLRDPVSSASHFLAAFLAAVATMFLARFTRGDPACRACALIFGGCAVLLYTLSGLYHALRLTPDELRVYQRLDMSAIYLLIAGSTTPMAALLLRGWFRVALLVGQWLCAVLGIAALWLLPKPDHAVLVGMYLAMGWLGASGLWHYWRATGWRGTRWALAGAGFYTGGAVIELANWPVLWTGLIRSHELLHFCDIAGTVCHLVFIARYCLPYRPGRAPRVLRPIAQPAGFALPAEA